MIYDMALQRQEPVACVVGVGADVEALEAMKAGLHSQVRFEIAGSWMLDAGGSRRFLFHSSTPTTFITPSDLQYHFSGNSATASIISKY